MRPTLKNVQKILDQNAELLIALARLSTLLEHLDIAQRKLQNATAKRSNDESVEEFDPAVNGYW